MKQIRTFSSGSMFDLTDQVNEFIKNNDVEIHDIQYSTASSGLFFGTTIEHSVMIVLEEK